MAGARRDAQLKGKETEGDGFTFVAFLGINRTPGLTRSRQRKERTHGSLPLVIGGGTGQIARFGEGKKSQPASGEGAYLYAVMPNTHKKKKNTKKTQNNQKKNHTHNRPQTGWGVQR